MFMSLMTPDGIDALVTLASEQWTRYIETWEQTGRVVLFDEVRELLCRAVCAWTGVPLRESEVEQRTADLGAMIDGSGAIGLRHWQGRRARTRAERWLEKRIMQVRGGKLKAAEGSALHAVSWHRTLDDELLDPKTAAVELLNVLRPTVAVARYVVFAAHALHEHPESRSQLRAGTDDEVERFVQEVRRLYPFFPFVGVRVRKSFTWNGYRFPDGQRTVLDLYGTNHDARAWDAPDTFRPTRFRHWDESPFDFIPQGGGDHATGHRCPGEWITIALMKNALHVLTEEMSYDVPEQDLRIPLSSMPALPNSRFAINNVHSTPNNVT